MRKWQNSTLTVSKPLRWLPRSRLIRTARRPAVPYLVQIQTRRCSGEIGTFLKYHSFSYITLLIQTAYRQTPRWMLMPSDFERRDIFQESDKLTFSPCLCQKMSKFGQKVDLENFRPNNRLRAAILAEVCQKLLCLVKEFKRYKHNYALASLSWITRYTCGTENHKVPSERRL